MVANHYSSGLGREALCRVGGNDKITSDTYKRALSPWATISGVIGNVNTEVRAERCVILWILNSKMVCVPCIVIPFVLWVFHKFIRPYLLMIWDPWKNTRSVKDAPEQSFSSSTPCGKQAQQETEKQQVRYIVSRWSRGGLINSVSVYSLVCSGCISESLLGCFILWAQQKCWYGYALRVLCLSSLVMWE